MSRLRNIVVLLRGQLWIIPLVISAAFFGLAFWILTSEATFLTRWEDADLWWLYGGDASSARGLMSSLLSGLMTMTSLVVSVTFVILTLAANQLGPRLVPTFMADRQIQAALGLFIGTILYVLVVLRSLDETLGSNAVPHLAVTIGSVLTAVCLFALLFYVHKIARSIIADNIVARVADELQSNIRTMLPDGNQGLGDAPPDLMPARIGAISIGRSGYIQVIDYAQLVSVACREEVLLEVKVRAGHFVLRSGEHVVVHGESVLGEKAADAVRRAFVVDRERSPAQDLEYGMRQLVEIGLRALSPGINDPYTAVAVIDRLGIAIEEIFQRPPQRTMLRDDKGTVRIIAQRSDLEGLVDAAFDAIRQAGREVPAVLIRMADILGQLAPAIRTGEAQGAVLRQLSKLAETAEGATLAPVDRNAVLSRIEAARKVVEAGSMRGKSHII